MKYHFAIVMIVAAVAIVGLIIIGTQHESKTNSMNDNAGSALKGVIQASLSTDGSIKNIQDQSLSVLQIIAKDGTMTKMVLQDQKESQSFTMTRSGKIVKPADMNSQTTYQSKMYNRNITIHILPKQGIWPGYSVRFLAYVRDADDYYYYGGGNTNLPANFTIPSPEGDVDIYFGITGYSADMNTLHLFYAISHPGSDDIYLDLNSIPELSQNFNEISSQNHFSDMKKLFMYVSYEKERAVLDMYTPFNVSQLHVYSQYKMQYLAPTAIYNNPANLDPKREYLMLKGDFFPGNTTLPIPIIIDQKDIISKEMDFYSTGYIKPNNTAPYIVFGYNDKPDYIPPNEGYWYFLASMPTTSTTRVAMQNNRQIEFDSEFDYPTYERTLSQIWRGYSQDLPDFYPLMKSPFIGYLNGLNGFNKGLKFILFTGDLWHFELDNMPDSTKIHLSFPDGHTVDGTRTFSINCEYPQFSNPPITSCQLGSYELVIDSGAIITDGKPQYEPFFLNYTGQYWQVSQYYFN